jgi:LysR family transcriptional regulator, carnitine catabolism transcriptional activator
MDFTSRQLRAFLLAAQHRNFSRAAEALFITPSGLSVLIRELEIQLGFRLFDRTTRHVAPTAYGREFLHVAQRCLTDLDSATARIGHSAEEAGQSLTVGAPPLLSANIVTPAIKEFRAHRPNLRIRLFDSSITTVREMVEAGKLDMGLGTFGQTPGLRRTPFLRSPLILIYADKDPAFRRSSVTWSALKGERLVSLYSHSPIQKIIDNHLKKAGVTSKPAITVNLLDTQIAAVEADEGIALIPSFGIPACRNRKIIMSRLINPVVEMNLYLISNRAKKLPSGAEEFTDFLKEFVGRWAGRAGLV